MAKFALVGDVGGTNARLALCDMDTGAISETTVYSALEHGSLEDVVKLFFAAHKDAVIKNACIAIACPITGDKVSMTNNPWTFSIAEMKANLGLDVLDIINVGHPYPASSRRESFSSGFPWHQ